MPLWAEVNGYNYFTVYTTLARWHGKKGEPKGLMARKIMKDIDRTLEIAR